MYTCIYDGSIDKLSILSTLKPMFNSQSHDIHISHDKPDHETTGTPGYLGPQHSLNLLGVWK